MWREDSALQGVPREQHKMEVWQVQRQRTVKWVMAFGAFDILHPGHVDFLSKARVLGDRLLVVVARDSTVRLVKKNEPLFDENARLKLVQSLKPVSLAVLGNEIKTKSDFFEIIKQFKPAVIALGHDQEINEKELKKTLKELDLETEVVRLPAKEPGRFKSSLIKKTLKER
jgi:FAD synthetase